MVEVKLDGAYAPNVYVSVMAVRGRVGGWRLWLADLARRWHIPWISREGATPTALVDLGQAQLSDRHRPRCRSAGRAIASPST